MSDPISPPAETDSFIEIAPLYDHLMNTVPYQDWVSYIKQILSRRNARPRNVLDLACGTGTVSAMLANEGLKVTGVDISESMINEAKRKAELSGLNIDFLVQDAAELDLPGLKFDLCVSLFDSLNYITDPAHLQKAFYRVQSHLNRNGLFIFDINTEYALKYKFFDQDNLGTDDELKYDWVSEYDTKTRICAVKMHFWHRREDDTQKEFMETHWQYAYGIEEIKSMLVEAGFENIDCYQAYTFHSPTSTSDRLFFICNRSL